MPKNKKELKKKSIIPIENFQRAEHSGVFPSKIDGFDLGIDLSQNKDISSMGFSLVERPITSSGTEKILWERKMFKDEKNKIEVRESWDSEVLNEREGSAVVPMVKESYEGNKGEVAENLTEQEEVVIRSSKWQNEKNEFEEKLTIKFDKGISSSRLIDGGQVNFVEHQQVSPMEDIDQSSISTSNSPIEVDFKPLLSEDEIRDADKAQLNDLKRLVDAELKIRAEIEENLNNDSQIFVMEVKPKS